MSVSVGVDCHEVSTNSGNNTSNVYLRIWIDTSGSSYHSDTEYGTIFFNGEEIGVGYGLPANSSTTVYEGTKDIGHDSNGDGSCSWGYSLPTTPSGGTKEDSGSIGLSHIARYLDSMNVWQDSCGLDWVKVAWNCSPSRNWAGWSTQMGIDDNQKTYTGSATYQEYVASDGKSGWFLIKNLNPATSCPITVKLNRADSGLASYRNINISTYDIARITSASNASLGSNLPINYSNPSGSNIEIGIFKTDGSTALANYRNCTGSSYTFGFSDTDLDNIYKAMGTTNSIIVRVYIRTANSYLSYATITITLTGNQKTGHVNIGGTWHRTKRWINIGGTWHKSI